MHGFTNITGKCEIKMNVIFNDEHNHSRISPHVSFKICIYEVKICF